MTPSVNEREGSDGGNHERILQGGLDT